MKVTKTIVVIAAMMVAPTVVAETKAPADQVPGEPTNETTEAKKYGISAAFAIVSFFGGSQSGPETFISDTNYQDTFETGHGLRVEGFREWKSGLRGTVGLIHNEWDGKFFIGGEFPNGAQFDDFSLTGVYVGVKYRFRPDSRVRPFWVGNFGIVRLSSLDVTVNGTEIPYWDSKLRDYLDMGGGIEYDLRDNVTFFVDARLVVFGEPDNGGRLIADATGATALQLTFGIDYKLWNRQH